jgi:D-alanyl-lipoteichoic acid acyltransferase DltB (MBOAT superfamily)
VLFNSYLFIGGFLPVSLAGFALACRLGRRAAMLWLIAASLFFYGWWSPPCVLLLVASIAGNYATAEAILRAARHPAWQTSLLAAGIAADLAMLAGFKVLAPVLPPGISFFTFTQIGYLLDCRTSGPGRRGLLDYGLFVGFFPHLISGPVPLGKEILPQLADPGTWRLSMDNIAVGSGIFVIGLLKKTLLADPLGPIVAQGFVAPADLTLLLAWQAALAWSLQLYFDFSGYSGIR